MARSYLNRSEQLLLFILAFFILQEWLRPIMQLTGTGYFGYFSVFVALCLGLSLFEIPKIVSGLIKTVYILWFVEKIYNRLNIGFFGFYKEELRLNFEAVFSADWNAITNPFRTMLFFILIWMLIYLINHWITVRISIFYFLLVTVIFIAVLDSYSDYDGSTAIVKVIVIGLLMTAILFIKRLILKRSILIDWQSILRFMIPIAVIVIGVSFVAYKLPKADSIWSDPVAFVTGIGKGDGEGIRGGTGTAQKVGYGLNDEKLGGPFVQDNTEVFQVTSMSRQYWRVETKDNYTSKGWRDSGGVDPTKKFTAEDVIEHTLPLGAEKDRQIAEVQNLSNYDFIMYPYGLYQVDPQIDEAVIRFNKYTEKATLQVNGADVDVTNYQLTFSPPVYNYGVLQNSDILTEFEEDRYLRLPSGMPKRIRELAEEITAPYENAYDKAKAIEKYFARNGFTYSTTDVAVPSGREDYVDQFLFETKVGYCDNFSTAMAVMLRTVDIPTRWVKGFVTGEAIDVTEDGRTVYQITNNEAHSWVEAYIDGVGWMPFEPTIGYANPSTIDYETQLPDEEELLEPTEEEIVIDETSKEEEASKDAAPVVGPNKNETTFDYGKLKWPAIIFVILIALAGIVVFVTRSKWLPKYYIYQNNKQEPTRKTYIQSYERLLKQLSIYGLKRSSNQTLSVYAQKVDRHFETDQMTKLTNVYEELIYRKEVDESKFTEMKEIWEYLINRASG